MMEKHFFIILIIFVMGCKKEIPFIDNFIDKGSITYSIMDNTPELDLYHPLRLVSTKHSFIVSDYQGDKIFTVINEFGKSYRFGNRGRGPEEFIDGYGLSGLTDSTFVIFDRMQKKVSYFKINHDTVFCYKILKIPLVNNIFPYNDSIFVTNGNVPFEKNYGVLDVSKDTVYSYIDYPKSKGRLPEHAKQRAYYSHIVRKPHSNRYIGFKASHYIIDVMSIEGIRLKLINRKIFTNNKWEMSKNVPIPGVRGTLNSITAKISGSNEKVFVCYKIQEGNKSQWSLLTFDWNGKPIDRYNIPFIPYAITTRNDSILYCIALIGEKYKLVKIGVS